MDNTTLLEGSQCFENLAQKNTNEVRRQAPVTVLLDKIEHINAQQLKYKAKVLAINKIIFELYDIVQVRIIS